MEFVVVGAILVILLLFIVLRLERITDELMALRKQLPGYQPLRPDEEEEQAE